MNNNQNQNNQNNSNTNRNITNQFIPFHLILSSILIGRSSSLEEAQGSNDYNNNNLSIYSQDMIGQQQVNHSQNTNMQGMVNSRFILLRRDNSGDRNGQRNQPNRSSSYQYITGNNRSGNHLIIESQVINLSPIRLQLQNSSHYSNNSNNQLDYSDNQSSSAFADQEEKDYIFGTDNLAVSTENIDFVKCTICMHIYHNPIACGNCLNHFCMFCIREWLIRNPNLCPLCKNFREMRCVPMLRNMLEKLKFYCINKKKGCDEIIGYEQAIKHEDQCDFRNEVCPILGCGQQMIKKLLDKHVSEECDYVLSSCRWCASQIKKRLIEEHEDTCDKKEVKCDLCTEIYFFKDQKEHFQKCPELIKECNWCQKKIKQREIRDHEDCCGERIVRCQGCNYECCLNDHFLHTKICQDIAVLCKRCLTEIKRKDLVNHSVENCIENVQRQCRQKIYLLENENRELKRQLAIQQSETEQEIIRINNIITRKNHPLQFSQVYKDQDIFVSQKGNIALVREYKKKRRDRFVIADQLQPLLDQNQTIIFKILSRRSEWFAIGICDESNIYSSRRYHDVGHLSYLISANGILYSSHSPHENWQNRLFRIEQDNVISVQFIYKPDPQDQQNPQNILSQINNNNININSNMNQNANIQINSNAFNNNESQQNSQNNNNNSQNQNINSQNQSNNSSNQNNSNSNIQLQENRRSNQSSNNQGDNSDYLQNNNQNINNNQDGESNSNNQINIQTAEMKLKFFNHTNNQELIINLDPKQILDGKFYYCVCLRCPGDSVEILPSV